MKYTIIDKSNGSEIKSVTFSLGNERDTCVLYPYEREIDDVFRGDETVYATLPVVEQKPYTVVPKLDVMATVRFISAVYCCMSELEAAKNEVEGFAEEKMIIFLEMLNTLSANGTREIIGEHFSATTLFEKYESDPGVRAARLTGTGWMPEGIEELADTMAAISHFFNSHEVKSYAYAGGLVTRDSIISAIAEEDLVLEGDTNYEWMKSALVQKYPNMQARTIFERGE